jgi:hypothetical protein
MPDLDAPSTLAGLFVLGIVAGVLNVLAGGGSLLTMPILIFLGMSPALANGTNRIALVAQNVVSVATFRRSGVSDFRRSVLLALCTLPGSVAGAFAAIRIDPTWFKRLLVGVMVLVLCAMFFDAKGGKGGAAAGDGGGAVGRGRLAAAYAGMVLVGFYGGFIQAGVGFIIMALLHRLLRLDLVHVNMHKVFVVAAYMLPSLAVFAALGEVRWIPGTALALGHAVGGWLGTRVQLSRGEKVVKVVFALAVVAMCIKLVLD